MIVVTGGAGFIGSAIIAGLNNKGIDDILVVDNLGNDHKWKNLRNLSFTDCLDKKDFLELIKNNKLDNDIQAVFHMGACSSTTEKDAAFLLENNYTYTKILAEYSCDNNVRFIYASSAATYGDGSKGFSDDHEKIDQLRPLNMYGYSKQLFDLRAKKTGMLKKIVGLKYFNVFGPNEYHKGAMRSYVIKAFEQITNTGKVGLFKSYNPQYKDGQQLRDFVYIKDAVDMTLFFLENPQAAGIFNIGTAAARNWNDLAKAVFDAMGKETNIEYIDMPESIRCQYQYFTQADITKIRNAGYKKQTTSLEDAAKDYVQNYLIEEKFL